MVRAKLDDLAVASDGSYFLMLISSEEGEVLPISIGPLEAHAIAAGRAEEKFSRPLTHDLFTSVLQLLDAAGDEVSPGPDAEGGRQEFPTRSDAESWVGECWADLAEEGVASVVLFEGDREVYGPMSLAAE